MRNLQNSLICFVLVSWLIGCNSDVQETTRKESVPGFSALLELISEADSVKRTELIQTFADTLTSTPYKENDTTAYFIYFGNVSGVGVAGDFNSWNPSGFSLGKIKDTDLWYLKRNFEENARLDYKLVLNGSSWILDPKNPITISGGFGPNSELSMPRYDPPWEIVKDEQVPSGIMVDETYTGALTGKDYQMMVYLPPGYSVEKKYPTVYFQDGAEYINLADANITLDNLIASGIIQPVIGVFVIPNNRNTEYAFDDRFKYKDFFVSQLVPFIDDKYSTIASPASRAVIGDSYGGNISAIIAFSHPEVFGNCGIHSGAFQPNNFSTNSIVMDGIKKDIRVATIWGTYEGASLPPNMRKVRDYLISTGYEVAWKELPEGHSWGLWRATLDEMLMFFFPSE
ncbi:MAG: alpha/beta hydrolase-fold protein [Cyclobacteriaceae bacterium]